MNLTVIGWIVLALPALLIGGFILQRWRVIQWLFLLVVVASLAYLTRTGFVTHIGERTSTYLPKAVVGS